MEKKVLNLVIIFLVMVVVTFGGVFTYEYFKMQNKNIGKQLHIVFTRDVDNALHVIYDGKDLGEMTGSYPVIAGENIAFERNINGNSHIIYNGQDLEIGQIPILRGGSISYLKDIQGKMHVIHNGEDFGEVKSTQSYEYTMSDNNIAINRDINGKTHIFYNKKDLGLSSDSGDSMLGENSIAFLRGKYREYHLIYNDKDIAQGNINSINAVSDSYVFYSKVDVNGNLHFYKNSEVLGSGDTILVAGEHYAIWVTNKDGSSHIVFDGKDIGEVSIGPKILTNGNIVFSRDIHGITHVIYNGNDLGEGIHSDISGDNIVFVREINSLKHIIYNGKDIGEGDYPMLYGNNIAFIRLKEGIKHVIFNKKDLGECEKNNCWPSFSESDYQY